jgi:2-isopropylmalate synthase
VLKIPSLIELDYYHILSGNSAIATATVRIKIEGKVIEEASTGEGPIDATYKAIERACNISCRLKDYSIKSVTSGKEALGEVVVKIELNGKIYIGRGLSTDIIEASALAFINALNKTLFNNNNGNNQRCLSWA